MESCAWASKSISIEVGFISNICHKGAALATTGATRARIQKKKKKKSNFEPSDQLWSF